MTIQRSIKAQVLKVHSRNQQRGSVSDGTYDTSRCIRVSIGDELTLLSQEAIERANRVMQISLQVGDPGEVVTVKGLDVASLQKHVVLALGEKVRARIISIGLRDRFTLFKNPAAPPLLYQHGIYLEVTTAGMICNGQNIK